MRSSACAVYDLGIRDQGAAISFQFLVDGGYATVGRGELVRGAEILLLARLGRAKSP